MRWRIYTEDQPSIRDAVAQAVEGATLITGSGLWRGNWENSLVVELVGVTKDAVLFLANRIKEVGKQEAVLVTCEPLEEAALV